MKKSRYEHVAEAFARISPSLIQSVAEDVAKGKPRTNFSREEQQAYDLLREVNVVTSHVAGSSAARVALRNEIRAMMIERGLPTFYITINPADTRNPIIRVLAGDDVDLDNLLDSFPTSEFQQSVFIANNPAVGATFFDYYMDTFIRTLLNYDSGADSQEPGVLGTVKSYYGCVEAQGRGSLHCHMLIWLDGALNIDEIKEKLRTDDDHSFSEQLISYLDDTISSGRPPKAEGYQESSVHPASSRPPADVDEDASTLSAHAQNDLRQLVEALQMHECNATCHKYCDPHDPNPKCRFNLDAGEVRPISAIDPETGDIHLRKLEAIVNNFNDTILRAIRNNMDIKFIGSGPSAKAVLYYITDYITKSQLETHVAYAALDSAIKKLGEFNPDEDDLMARAKRLLQRCAYMMIKHQELSAQQVASYVMGYPDHYKSHECSKFYWTSFESHIDSELPSPECYLHKQPPTNDVPTSTTGDDPTIDDSTRFDDEQMSSDAESDIDSPLNQVVPSLNEESSFDDDTDIAIESPTEDLLLPKTDRVRDYIYRSENMSEVCLWDFVAQFTKVKAKPKAGDTEPRLLDVEADLMTAAPRKQPSFSFFQEHPDHETHVMRMRPSHDRRHPNPLGPPLPRRDVSEYVAKHARLMLILFKPWRDSHDLIEDFDSWHSAYTSFVECASRRVRTFIDNMQLLHECRDSRDDHFAARRAQNRRQRPISLVEDPSDEAMQNAILTHIEDVSSARSHHRSAAQVEADACVDAACRHGLFDDTDHDVHMGDFEDDRQGTNITHETLNKEAFWKAQYDEHNKRWKSDLRHAPNDRCDPGSTFDNVPSAMPDHLFWSSQNYNIEQDNHVSVLTSASPEPRLARTSVDDVISDFGLNIEQSRAFKIVAEHSARPKPNQLRMYLGGAGGTGKSRVISALQAFFERNNESRRLRLTSYTGVAAKNINGMTLHSALSLNQRHNNKLSQRAKEELIAFWEGVDYLFMDEVSMTGCRFLLQVNDALTDAKRCNQPFGGVNVIFAGDFAQLPPVCDRKLYANVSSTNVGTAKGLKIVLGKLLWSSVSTVVILSEVMRQNADSDDNAAFVGLLGRLRLGNCTQSDFLLLRTRLISNPNLRACVRDWQAAPIIVSKNECKDSLNEKAAQDFASRTGRQLHWYYATDTWASEPVNHTGLRDALCKLSSNKCEQRLGRLPLVIGMPVMLSTNYEVQSGIVNGCTGTLIDIRYTVDAEGRRHASSCIIQSDDTIESSLTDLPTNAVACIQDKVKFAVKHPDTGTTCQIERTQVPILPAFAITAHKSQAQTMLRTTADIESCHGSESPYVMLSRVKSLDGLLILRPFQLSKIQCRPSPDLRQELRRLEVLRLHTISNCGTVEECARAMDKLSAMNVSIDAIAPTPLSRDLQGAVGEQLSNLQSTVAHLRDIDSFESDDIFSGSTAAKQRPLKRKLNECS